MYINLTNNRELKLDSEWHFLNPFLLSYEEVNSSSINCICEEYPHNDLSSSILKAVSNKVYEKTWNALYKTLNDYNKVDFSVDFWKMYASYNYYFFINTFYERYVEIKKAIERHPSVEFVISERVDDYYIAKQTEERASIFSDQNIVLAIDWQILDYFGIRPKIIHGEKTIIVHTKKKKVLLRNKIKNQIKRALNYVNSFRYRDQPIIFMDMAYNAEYTKLLPDSIKDSLWFPYSIEFNHSMSGLDKEYRDTVIGEVDFKAQTEFEELFFSYLFRNLFFSYIESFGSVLGTCMTLIKTKPRAMCSCGRDERKLMCAAITRENGGVAIDLAHSMSESFTDSPYCKSMEYYDYLLEWANASVFWDSRCRHFGDSRLKRLDKVSYENNKTILYICTDIYTSTIMREMDARVRENWNLFDYAGIPLDFYRKLLTRYRGLLLYRIRDDYGRKMGEYLNDYAEKAIIDSAFSSNGITLAERIKQARIVICDGINSTAFYEALSMGVPTIVIDCCKKKDFYTREMLEVVTRMERVGVIVRDGFEAAATVNENYDTIYEWWKEKKRANVIDDMRKIFDCNVDGNRTDWFYDFIVEIMEKQKCEG